MFKPQGGNHPVGKVEQEKNRELFKDPERDSHLHEPSTAVQAAEEGRED